jgi:hypothetical protein
MFGLPHFFQQSRRLFTRSVPLEDQTATDKPHVENLLPDKRPEEAKKCFDSGVIALPG